MSATYGSNGSVPADSHGPFGGQPMQDAGAENEPQKLKIDGILARQHKMESERSLWETNWQEILDHVAPRKADVVATRTPGSIRGDELFDTTAIEANNKLGGALHGMLTNPTTRFFDLTMGDAKLDAITEVRAWLDDTADDMYRVLAGTNFQTEIAEIYSDLGSIGTAALWMGEDETRFLHFKAIPIKEIFVMENNLGLIDIVHRKFEWTVRQIVQEWGRESLPPDFQDETNYHQRQNDKMIIIHAVYPSEDKTARGVKKIESCYLLRDKRHILKEGGFNEFPYAVPRWSKSSGEVYGRGPGMDALPDIRMLQEMMLTTLQGAQKVVDPPLLAEDDGVIGRVRIVPGGITIVRPGGQGGPSGRVVPLITNSRIDFGYQAMEDIRKRVRAAFFQDQLQLRDGPQKTATEVQQITEENLRLMGPILSRQEFEFLNPGIDRLFGTMRRKGRIRPPPPQIAGKAFSPKYSSLVARAQRMSEGQNFGRMIAAAAPLFQLDPTLADSIDTRGALKELGNIYGVTQRVFRSDREVKQLQEGRAQAQAKLAQEQSQQHQADLVDKTAPGIAKLAAVSGGQPGA